IILMIFVMLAFTATALAQTDIAAVLTVESAPVEVQRVNTAQWLPVNVEAIVGVGDQIRTLESGEATITFFADGVQTTLEPETTYRIDVFNGDSDTFNLSVSVLAGQTRQRIDRALDAGSNYDVNTPGANLVARGTAFQVRVEPDGRSAMLVSEGAVEAGADTETATVQPTFGIRSEASGTLSDVVSATTFEQLDAAIDGCAATVTTPDDVSLNVRLGPNTDFDRVGTIAAEDITVIKGVAGNQDWYRIDFDGGFGWILSSTATIDSACPGLREFDPSFGPEDASLFGTGSAPIESESPPSTATEEATG
ncbi:MAG: FecR domain-containing protein, partial [Chloroflexota bacterium]